LPSGGPARVEGFFEGNFHPTSGPSSSCRVCRGVLLRAPCRGGVRGCRGGREAHPQGRVARPAGDGFTPNAPWGRLSLTAPCFSKVKISGRLCCPLSARAPRSLCGRRGTAQGGTGSRPFRVRGRKRRASWMSGPRHRRSMIWLMLARVSRASTTRRIRMGSPGMSTGDLAAGVCRKIVAPRRGLEPDHSLDPTTSGACSGQNAERSGLVFLHEEARSPAHK